jgi:geranylgeranyl diphosphate synthase type I
MEDFAKPESVTVMLERVARPVVARIDALLTSEIDRWSHLDSSLAEPLTSLRTFVLAGGKRLRPAFCHWAFVGAGGDPLDAAVTDAGAALELLHSFALVHDDVMDDSLVRRGADAVHVQFKEVHSKLSLVGEARRYGEGVAILIGDMAFVYADKLMNSAPQEAIEVFTELRVELNVGQYLDISATARSDATLPMARKIAQFKSGKYTVERPLHLGAALAGRFDELATGLSAYGIPVGEAFQLRDDILGAFGDADVIGKPVGGDLREGKPTALLAVARQEANSSDAAFLDEHYGKADISESEVAELQRILTDTGARAHVESSIDHLTEAGLEAVESLALTDGAKQNLVGLAHFLAGREL